MTVLLIQGIHQSFLQKVKRHLKNTWDVHPEEQRLITDYFSAHFLNHDVDVMFIFNQIRRVETESFQ